MTESSAAGGSVDRANRAGSAVVEVKKRFQEVTAPKQMGTVRIGVTGHQVLAEVDKVTGGIDTALRAIEAAYPGDFVEHVSSLAEGADRLVTRRVLQAGGRLIVPLPLPRDDYANDFASDESRREFLDLLARAAEVIALPRQASRPDAYRAAGLYVLDHCDVLLAVWDGKDAQGTGGTAEMVARARARRLPIVWVHAGNRLPATNEPTSLGEEQGGVTYENFHARNA